MTPFITTILLFIAMVFGSETGYQARPTPLPLKPIDIDTASITVVFTGDFRNTGENWAEIHGDSVWVREEPVKCDSVREEMKIYCQLIREIQRIKRGLK